MPKAGFIVARVFSVMTASALGAAMLAAPAAGQTSCAAPSGKCFAVAPVSPSNPVAGVSTSFMFTITNGGITTQQLGSVQISAPAGSTITGASLFLNLSLAPSASTTLTVNATVSCSSSTYQWGIKAKQSNDFNGTGNDFQLDPNSVKNLQGSCSLQPCPSTCSATALSATTVGTVTTSDAGPNDSIATGMEDARSPNSSFNFSCGTYKPVSDAFGFAVFDAQGNPKPCTSLSRSGSTSPWSQYLRSSRRFVLAICYAFPTHFTPLLDASGSHHDRWCHI